jgi:DnaJ family protein C protein 8
MAGRGAAVTLVPAGQEPKAESEMDAELAAFMTEVHTIMDAEKLSDKDQIARLFRPGAKYFNMNPFEVLGLSHKASSEDVRKAYRRMSVQVHPDKNPGNELAQPAFELVKAAHERLEDSERMAFCQRICAAAEEAVEKRVAKDKKKLRKEGQEEQVPEDEPEKMALSVKVMISRMFSEFESRKRQLETRDVEARKKAKEEQAEREFMEALAKREQKMWERSRQKRVNGWRSWSSTGGGKSKIPNKVKEERRPDGSGYNSYWDDKGEDYKKEWR